VVETLMFVAWTLTTWDSALVFVAPATMEPARVPSPMFRKVPS